MSVIWIDKDITILKGETVAGMVSVFNRLDRLVFTISHDAQKPYDATIWIKENQSASKTNFDYYNNGFEWYKYVTIKNAEGEFNYTIYNEYAGDAVFHFKVESFTESEYNAQLYLKSTNNYIYADFTYTSDTINHDIAVPIDIPVTTQPVAPVAPTTAPAVQPTPTPVPITPVAPVEVIPTLPTTSTPSGNNVYVQVHNDMSNLLGDLNNTLDKVSSDLSDSNYDVGLSVSTAIGDLNNEVSGSIYTGLSGLSGVVQGLYSAISSPLEFIGSTLNGVMDGISTVIRDTIDGLIRQLQDLVNWLEGKLLDLLEALLKRLGNMLLVGVRDFIFVPS